jgi:hypothetical protein
MTKGSFIVSASDKPDALLASANAAEPGSGNGPAAVSFSGQVNTASCDTSNCLTEGATLALQYLKEIDRHQPMALAG